MRSVVEAEIEFYTFDRVKQILDAPNESLDSGNGFVFDDGTGVKSQFGYIAYPAKLEDQIGESLDGHSPLLGWAFDGNPIYGSNVYVNAKNANDGIKKAYSSYINTPNRTGVKSSLGTFTATNPPSESEYPLGTFLEDYVYDPENATFGLGYINSELADRINAENGDLIPFSVCSWYSVG